MTLVTNEPNPNELELRKFEYSLLNDKLALNVARLDKLWLALVGGVLGAVTYGIGASEGQIVFVLLPLFIALWGTLMLYVLGQIQRQKQCILWHAKAINSIVGCEILIYDTRVMSRLWRYGRALPSAGMVLLVLVVALPGLGLLVYSLSQGYQYIDSAVSRGLAVAFVVSNLISLGLGIAAFFLGRLTDLAPSGGIRTEALIQGPGSQGE